MHQQIENLKHIRTYLLNQIGDLTVEQLNQVLEGFNNNMIWNLAHLIATQQRICYVSSNLQPIVHDKYISPFAPGTKPDGFIDATEVETIKSLFISTLDELETDYKKSFFTTYDGFTTRYGVELININDAIAFLPYHEGLHAGAILALKKVLTK